MTEHKEIPSGTPFRRLLEYRQKIEAIFEKNLKPFFLRQELQSMAPYDGNGKGGKRKPRCAISMAGSNQLTNRSKYSPHQGRQEIARRFAKENPSWQ